MRVKEKERRVKLPRNGGAVEIKRKKKAATINDGSEFSREKQAFHTFGGDIQLGHREPQHVSGETELSADGVSQKVPCSSNKSQPSAPLESKIRTY